MDMKHLPSRVEGSHPPENYTEVEDPPPPYSEMTTPSAPPAYLAAQEPIKSEPTSARKRETEFGAAPTLANPRDRALRYLGGVDKLLIKPRYEVIALTGTRTIIRFDILNTEDQLVFLGGAEPTLIKDIRGHDIIALQRARRGPEYLQEMTIESPPGCPAGKISQDFTFCSPKFTITDENDKRIYRISTTGCPGGCSCCHEGVFQITDAVSSCRIGDIVEEWTEPDGQQSKSATSFIVSFPREACIQHRTLLLSAVFLLNFMFPERPQTGAEGLVYCCLGFLRCCLEACGEALDSDTDNSREVSRRRSWRRTSYRRPTTTSSSRWSSGGRTTTTFSGGGGGSTTTTFS